MRIKMLLGLKREKMMSEEFERKIEELYQRFYSLKAERDDLNRKAQTWADKRDRLHKEIQELRLQIRDLRQRRDSLNEEVKRLKSLREAELKRRNEIFEEINKLREEKGKINARKPRKSRSYLKGEIERIEWRIQTEPLPLDVEKELIEKIRTLESQMEVYRRIERIENKISVLRREVERLKEAALNYRSRILEIATQSQEFHLKMIKKIEYLNELKLKADEMHKQYVENKEKVKAINIEIKKILMEIQEIRNLLNAKEEKERRQKQAELQKQTEEKALEKLQRGEKLTFDEFKILLEKGRIR